MNTDIKANFLTCYNEKAPRWKKITEDILLKDKTLKPILGTIEKFIEKNNLNPQILVNAVVKFYSDNNKMFPNLFLFIGDKALNIYKNNKLENILTLNELQQIILSVKKSKKILKMMIANGIIYSRGVYALSETGKADYYFLLAHGIQQNIPKDVIERWDNNQEIKKLVLDEIFSD